MIAVVSAKIDDGGGGGGRVKAWVGGFPAKRDVTMGMFIRDSRVTGEGGGIKIFNFLRDLIQV